MIKNEQYKMPNNTGCISEVPLCKQSHAAKQATTYNRLIEHPKKMSLIDRIYGVVWCSDIISNF